ncbi:fimbrial protein [Serratia sp. D1N4]
MRQVPSKLKFSSVCNWFVSQNIKKDKDIMRNYKQALKKTLLCMAVASIGVSYSALAVDLKITGTVKASPCTVVADSGNNINVDLGTDIQATTLTAQKGSPWKPVVVRLKDCPTTTTSITAAFSGTQADEETGLYKNAGDADKVQIELQDVATGVRKGNGSTLVAPVVLATNDATFNLQARAYSSTGGAAPGSVIGTVQVAFTYQ